jgi:Kdo2-lipid IVA lauroyltransferase/acyltransferase
VKTGIEYFFFSLATRLAGMLSYSSMTRLGALAGALVFRLTPVRKRVVFDNLSHAFPEKTEAGLRAIALGAYRNYGTAIFTLLWCRNRPEEELRRTVHLRNREVLDRFLHEHRAFILLSGHFGSWELITQAVRLHVGRPFTIIVQTQRNRRVDALVNSVRCRFGNTVVPMGPSSARELLRVLKEGGTIAALADQSAARESLYVPYFGRPVAAHRGIAALSLRAGAPILMHFLIRRPDRTFDVVFEEVPSADLTGYSEENILELTRRHTAMLERYVRLHPDHWLWMHKRWKHTAWHEQMQEAPAGEADSSP